MAVKENTRQKIIRKLRGIVTSDKMDKTIVVKVDRTKVHSKYKKRYVTSKKYKVHDRENECAIGDYVEFAACRPISKDKQWKMIEILKQAPKVEKLPEVQSEIVKKEREDKKKQEILETEQTEQTEVKEEKAIEKDSKDKTEKKKKKKEDKQVDKKDNS